MRAANVFRYVLPIQSSGHLSGAIVTWMLDRNRIEFTFDEFREMTAAIHAGGLFKYLTGERPALLSQLTSIVRDKVPDIEETEMEFVLEQALLNLQSRL